VSEGGDGPRKIKVVDRRRFDDSGEPRPDRPAPEPKPESTTPEPPTGSVEQAPATASAKQGSAPDRTTTSPSDPVGSGTATSPMFMELVAALAQQAEMMISGAQGLPAQPAEAQRVIDYLSILETKTRGNLSAEEKQILSNVIFQLRTLYVQQAK
jgi:hypothetical protein